MGGHTIRTPLRIDRRLGSPRSETFLAVERGHRKPTWVLKWLPVDPATRLVDQLRPDALDLCSMAHPSLALPRRFGVDDGGPELVTAASSPTQRVYQLTPYVDSVPLDAAAPDLRPETWLECLLAAVEGLGVLHRAGFLHRNLKASSLLLPAGAANPRGPRLVLCSPAWWPSVSPSTATEAPVEEPTVATRRREIAELGAVFQRLLDDRIEQEPTSTRFSRDLLRVLRKMSRVDPGSGYERLDDVAADLRRASDLRLEPNHVAPDVLVHREGPLEQVRRRLRQRPQACAVVLWGEAGIGKSAFLRRVALEGQLENYRTVEVSCYSEPGATGGPFEMVARRLWPARSSFWRRYRKLLIARRDSDRDASIDSDDGARFVRGFLNLLCESHGDRPTLILMDDAHQADASTLEILRALLREISTSAIDLASTPPSLAVSFRNEAPFRRALEPIRKELSSGSAHPLELTIGPLPAEAVATWCRKTRSPPSWPADGGEPRKPLLDNPFAIREALRRGRSPHADSQDQDGAASAHAAYLGALTQDERRVLNTLAILGRPTPRKLLRAIVDCSSQALDRAVGALLEGSTLEEDADGVFFEHASLRTWLQTGMESKERQRIHARIARTLAAGRGEPLERVAAHWLRSNEPHSGITTAFEAARSLAERHRHREAAELFEAALALLPPESEEYSIACEEAAHAQARSGQFRKGMELLESLLARHDESSNTACLRGRLGVLAHRSGDIDRAIAELENALSGLEAGADDASFVDRLQFESELAEIATNRGEYERAHGLCSVALARISKNTDLANDGEVERQRVILLETLGHLHMRRFEYVDAEDFFTRSLAAARRRGSSGAREAALILNNLGSLYTQTNRFEKAAECFRRAVVLSNELGEDQSVTVLLANLAVVYAKLGEPDAADDALRRAASHDARCESKKSTFLRLHCQALVQSLLGRFESALDDFRNAIVLGEELGDHFVVAFDRVFLAECHIWRGELRAARSSLERAGDAASLPAPLARMVHARLELIHAMRGTQGATRREADVQNAPEERFTYLEAWNRLFLGWSLRLRGDGEAARRTLETAAEIFRRIRVPAGEIHAQLEIAATQADAGHGRRALQRLARLRRRFALDRGALRNTMLCARLLVYESRFLLQGSEADPRRAGEVLAEAENYLIGRQLRDLETLVEELRQRVAPCGVPAARSEPPHSGPDETEWIASWDALAAELRERLLGVDDAHSVGLLTRLDCFCEAFDKLRRGLSPSERATQGPGIAAIVGESPAIAEVLSWVRRTANTALPVSIRGDTGTGKELVARAIHAESRRRDRPFLVINCSALPEDLLESELFGYAQGAFSGADRDRKGLLQDADGGTVLFDQIDDLPLGLQGKLLRILDHGTLRPLGSDSEVEIDVRYLFSTTADLRRRADKSEFREDLYFRISALEIIVPALRERPEDLPRLIEHFRDAADREGDREGDRVEFDATAMRALVSHDWPGNVRELRNVVMRLVLMSDGKVTAEDVQAALNESTGKGLFPTALLRSRSLRELTAELEREYVVQRVRDLDGDFKRLAVELDISLRALYLKLRRLGLEPKKLRGG